MSGPLPNPHAALVHFPIALLLVAAAMDALALARPSRPFLRNAASLLFALGALFLVPTFLTGMAAGDEAQSPVPGMQRVLGEHQDWATWTLGFYLTYASARTGLELRRKRGRVLHATLFIAGLAGAGLVATTGLHGGELVYEKGVGVRPLAEASARAPGPAAPAAVAPPQSGLTRGAAGERRWTYAPGAEAGFAQEFEPLEGSLPPEVSASAEGLRLYSGAGRRVVLGLGPERGSVEMEVWVRLDAFRGVFGLVHHARDATRFDFAAVDSSAVHLGRMSETEQRIFQRAGLDLPAGWVRLHVVSSGRHLRLYRNDQLLIHAHAPETPAGRVGLWIEGAGAVELREIVIRSLEPVARED